MWVTNWTYLLIKYGVWYKQIYKSKLLNICENKEIHVTKTKECALPAMNLT